MMIEFSEIPHTEIRKFVSDFLNGKRPLLSNFFVAESQCNYEIAKTDSTVFIRKTERDFYRLFIVTINKSETISELKSLDKDVFVINIPTKSDISEWNDFLTKAGFQRIGHYKRLYNQKVKFRKSALNTFAQMQDIDAIEKLLLSNFSIYIDYLPDRKELEKMVMNNQIIADYDDKGNICGVLIYTLEGRKCYLNAWIDIGNNGLFLLYKAYNIAFENNINYVYFWVNSENTNVLKLHEMMGAQYDGLNDYTYIKTKK